MTKWGQHRKVLERLANARFVHKGPVVMTDLSIASDQNTAATSAATVFIVDDDADVRRSISILARSVELEVETFASAQDFLDNYTGDRPGCLVLDVRMPGMTGLELQGKLSERREHIPTIVLTAHAEVSMATQAMRNGALDFITKPFSPQALLERIHEAIVLDHRQREVQAIEKEVFDGVATLTDREREIMHLLVEGKSTKVIASQLEISPKTVDNHRTKILEKMQLENTAELATRVTRYFKQS